MAKALKGKLTTQQKIRTLFDRYAANFALYSSLLPGRFLCPLCERDFSEDAIASGELSLAHIVPKSCGGTVCTLLCKECNNGLGTGVEGHADKRKKVFASLEGDRKEAARIDVAVQVSDGQEVLLPGYVRGDARSRTLDIEFKHATSSPEAFQRTLEMMKKAVAAGETVKFGLQEPRHFRHEIANLIDFSIAYHALFALMGYEFVFSPLGRSLRKILRWPEKPGNLTTCYGLASDENWAGVSPGMVVELDGYLGVVMPKIAAMQPRRVLFVGRLMEGSLVGEVFTAGGNLELRKVHELELDEHGLPQLPSFAGAFSGMTLELRRADEKERAGV